MSDAWRARLSGCCVVVVTADTCLSLWVLLRPLRSKRPTTTTTCSTKTTTVRWTKDWVTPTRLPNVPLPGATTTTTTTSCPPRDGWRTAAPFWMMKTRSVRLINRHEVRRLPSRRTWRLKGSQIYSAFHYPCLQKRIRGTCEFSLVISEFWF